MADGSQTSLTPDLAPIVSDEINLRNAWRAVRASAWQVLMLLFIFTTLGTLVAFILPPQYRAETVLSPVSAEDRADLSRVLGSDLGSAVSLLGGKSLGGNSADEAVATLTGRQFLGDFIGERKLLPILFADQWDATKKTWIETKPEDIPTLNSGVEIFRDKLLSVTKDAETGLVTLAVVWKNPTLAADWANDLVRRANDKLQKQAIQTADARLDFLHKQLATVETREIRDTLFGLIRNQINQSMTASVSKEYAFKVIDPAIAPDLDNIYKPNRPALIALSFLAGLLVAGLFVYARNLNADARSERR